MITAPDAEPEVEIEPEAEPLSTQDLTEILSGARGVSSKLADNIISQLGLEGALDALNHHPEKLTEVKNIKARKLSHIMKHWEKHLETC